MTSYLTFILTTLKSSDCVATQSYAGVCSNHALVNVSTVIGFRVHFFVAHHTRASVITMPIQANFVVSYTLDIPLHTFVYVGTFDHAPFGNGGPLEPTVAGTVETMVDQIHAIARNLTAVFGQALVHV